MNNWKPAFENPDEEGDYIVKAIVNTGTQHIAKCVFIGFWDNGLQKFCDGDGEPFYGIELTGWMPLPEYE